MMIKRLTRQGNSAALIIDRTLMDLMDIDQHTVRKYPREYAPLAYLLDKSGFPVERVFATKGSTLEAQMKDAGNAWLQS